MSDWTILNCITFAIFNCIALVIVKINWVIVKTRALIDEFKRFFYSFENFETSRFVTWVSSFKSFKFSLKSKYNLSIKLYNQSYTRIFVSLFKKFIYLLNKFSQRKNKIIMNIRDFNKIIQFDVYSIQLQFDLISIVIDCVYISIFDYINFFHQWFVKLTNRHKLTIVSHKENEQWNVAIMSFRNSLVYVQRQINRIFREFRFFVKIYVNDIVIFNHNLEKHLRHLN